MAKPIHKYTTINNLQKRLEREQQDRSLDSNKRVLMGGLVQELADYCGLTLQAIDKIRLNINQPSAPVMLKIAEYYESRAEQIFALVPVFCPECEKEWDLKGKRSPLKLSCEGCGYEYKKTIALNEPKRSSLKEK